MEALQFITVIAKLIMAILGGFWFVLWDQIIVGGSADIMGWYAAGPQVFASNMFNLAFAIFLIWAVWKLKGSIWFWVCIIPFAAVLFVFW